MTAQRYEIHEAFRYSAATLAGDVSGEFSPGVTGDDLTDEQAAYLDAFAVPQGLASRVGDAPVPTPDPAPVPTPDPAPEPDPVIPPAPQESAPAPSDTQEQAQ